MSDPLAHSQPPASFNLPSSDSSDNEDDGSLPFPTALPRTDFLASEFQPAAYLSALPYRHQTLEDLRSDLRERTGSISSELMELVNSNYTAFLSLGSELRGGDDKVEDVKMSLLSFRKGVEDVKEKVASRRKETDALTNELGSVRAEIELGRKFLELSERLSSLEENLAMESLPKTDIGEDLGSYTSEDEEDGGADRDNGLHASSPSKLLSFASEYRQLSSLTSLIDEEKYPFIRKLQARLMRCRSTLLLDLNHALKEAKSAGAKGQDRILGYLEVFSVLNAQGDAIKLLRGKR